MSDEDKIEYAKELIKERLTALENEVTETLIKDIKEDHDAGGWSTILHYGLSYNDIHYEIAVVLRKTY